MKYVAHHRYKGKDAGGGFINIPYGTECTTVGDFITTLDGKLICSITSEIAKKFFAINDDGLGLERGSLTYAIAYSDRNVDKGFRFSEEEIKTLCDKYNRFLIPDISVILFNDDFFKAHLYDLKSIANELNIKIKR